MTHQSDTPSRPSGLKPEQDQATFRERWIEKLKDPSTKKTCEYLHNDEGECCLGVAMTMNGASWAPGGDHAEHHGINCGREYYDLHTYEDGVSWQQGNELSRYGRQQAGITLAEQGALTTLNDRSHTFRRIIAFLALCPDRTAPFDDDMMLTEAQRTCLHMAGSDNFPEEGDDDAGC